MSTVQNAYVEELTEIRDEDSVQLVGFKLGDEEYAIDVLKIQEIIRLIEITAVPRMEQFILGVINLRGKVIPVVDLRVRFELEKSDFDKKTRIIVVKFEKENIGFVVDEVTEVIRIDKGIVEPTPPLVGSVGQEYILGICKYLKRLIILLDIDRIVYDDENLTSDLKKKFSKTPIEQPSKNIEEVTDEEESSNESQIDFQKNEEQSTNESSRENITTSNSNDESVFEENNSDLTDNIDKLIAMELAKREKETEELLSRKKTENQNNSYQESLNDVLQDALNQANVAIPAETNHVDQDDLDTLIAIELAKREQETEELLMRKKEEEEKKKLIELPDAQETLEKEIVSESLQEQMVLKRDSLSDLKSLASKIINGETQNLTIDIKGEIGDLLNLLFNTKEKLDELAPAVTDSNTNLPFVAKSLENVNEYTEDAATNLMDAADKMSNFFGDLNEKVKIIEKNIEKSDVDSVNNEIQEVEKKLIEAEELGFNILQALEFQDITEQKARKVIKKLEEIGARLGTILGYAKIHGFSGASEKGTSQSDIDSLLSEFGLG